MVYGQVFHQERPDEGFIIVSVGGFRQRLDRGVLNRFPQTRLGRLRCSSTEAIPELCHDFSPSEMEFYFDRNPCFFFSATSSTFTSLASSPWWKACAWPRFAKRSSTGASGRDHLAVCCRNTFHKLVAFAEDQPSQEGSSSAELSADTLQVVVFSAEFG